MAFGDNPVKMAGIKKEEQHFMPLKKLFETDQSRQFIKSTIIENQEDKVDFWNIVSGKKHAYDFKSASNSAIGFNVTYKPHNETRNEFELGVLNRKLIFLFEHTQEYVIVLLKDLENWFNEHHPKVNPCKDPTDNSTWFHIPSREVLKMAKRRVSYKTFIE